MKNKKSDTDKLIKNGLIICLVLFVLSILAPFVLTEPSISFISFKNTGEIGDTIGGITAPFIGLISAILVYLALKAQIDANVQVSSQFQLQKFENQFYEMIRLHKENVNEMTIKGYDREIIEFCKYTNEEKDLYEKESFSEQEVKNYTSGRKVFVTMITELKAVYEMVCAKIPENENYQIFDLSYFIFFDGLDSFERFLNEESEKGESVYKDSCFTELLYQLKIARRNHSETSGKANNFFDIKLHFKYKPFSGHQSRLGHYYRHLFQTVKFVVNYDGEVLSYSDKRNYLRILRAQLSNHEQLMLFYNWYSGYGSKWEQEKGNHFFTNYRMIHNIPESLIFIDIDLVDLFNEVNKKILKENEFDDLFEFQEWN
jgi:hypothetical protein